MSRLYTTDNNFRTGFAFPGASSFTISAWIHHPTHAFPSFDVAVCEISDNAQNNVTQIRVNQLGQIGYTVSQAGVTAYVVVGSFVFGSWHHLAMVYDSSSGGRFTSYLDGVMVGSPLTGTTLTGRSNANYIRFGVLAPTAAPTLQDAMLFDVALTDAQRVFAMTRGQLPVSAYGWWSMQSAAPFADSSGNGRTLSAGGADGVQLVMYGNDAATTTAGSNALDVTKQLVSAESATTTAGAATVTGGGSLNIGGMLGNNGPPTSRHWLGRRNLRERL